MESTLNWILIVINLLLIANMQPAERMVRPLEPQTLSAEFECDSLIKGYIRV